MPSPPEYSPDFRSRFHPDHLDDLARSGLSEKTITTLDIRTLTLVEFSKYVGRQPHEGESALLFPYPGLDDFCRVKVFPSFRDRDGHIVKYLQRRGSGVHVYVPPLAEKVLNDPTRPLAITEGEKKAAKACQEGIPTVGIGGLWNWLERGLPIADLDRIAFHRRLVSVACDSDTWGREDLLRAVYALGWELQNRGAVVGVVRLPLEGEEKVGLDDYLVRYSPEAFWLLDQTPLDAPVFEKARRWHGPWLAQRAQAPGMTGAEPERPRVHFGQGAWPGGLSYGIIRQGRRFVVISDRRVLTVEEAGGEVVLYGGSDCVHPCSWAAGERFRSGAEERTGPLLADLEGFFRRFLVLPESWWYKLLPQWSLGTYCYRLFGLYPYLFVTSAVAHCGKTRCLEILQQVCFDASRVLTHPSEAVLFRMPTLSGGTILLDEMERLKESNKDLYGSMVSILDVGFQATGTVSRMVRAAKDKWEMEHFEVYAPRALATTESLVRSLEDRALILPMVRKTSDERVSRWSPRRVEAEAQAFRDRAAIWALSHAPVIRDRYEGLGEIECLAPLDDRGKDLFEPLWVIGSQAAEERDPTWQLALAQAAESQAGHRAQSQREDLLPALIESLLEFRRAGTEEATTEVLIERFQREPELRGIDNERRLGHWLGQLRLRRVRRQVGGHRVRFYVLDEAKLADLTQRYCPV